MFRLLRLIIFTMFAFVAGMLYERSNAQTACTSDGGEWRDAYCIGVDQ